MSHSEEGFHVFGVIRMGPAALVTANCVISIEFYSELLNPGSKNGKFSDL